MVKISSTLASKEKDNLLECLRENTDVFYWSTANMPGVDPQMIFHKLNVLNEAKPVK